MEAPEALTSVALQTLAAGDSRLLATIEAQTTKEA